MFNYAFICLALFTILLGPAINNSFVTAQAANRTISPPEDNAALEAEIAKLVGNVTRISQLPPDTIYTFKQQYFNETNGQLETVTISATARELLTGFDTPSGKNNKRGEPEFGPVCETSTGSPFAVDVIKAMVTMSEGERQFCCQWSILGSRCHTMETHLTGAVGICGPFMRCCPCLNTIDFLLILVDKCRFRFPDGRLLVGGKFNLGPYGMSPPYGGYLLAYHT